MVFQKGHKINLGKKHSEATKEKMREKHKGQEAWNKKIKCPQISNSLTNRKLSINHCENLSKSHKGKFFGGGFKKGSIPWNKGKKGTMSKASIDNLRKSLFGKIDEDAKSWKGDDCGRVGMHHWVVRKKGKANEYKCEHCGKQARHWSNKDHTYKRILEDYQPLCASCHKKYDLKNN